MSCEASHSHTVADHTGKVAAIAGKAASVRVTTILSRQVLGSNAGFEIELRSGRSVGWLHHAICCHPSGILAKAFLGTRREVRPVNWIPSYTWSGEDAF